MFQQGEEENSSPQVHGLMARKRYEQISDMQRGFIDKRDRKIDFLKAKDELVQNAVKKFTDEVNDLIETTEAAYHVQGSDRIRTAYDRAKEMTVKVADLLRFLEIANSQENTLFPS